MLGRVLSAWFCFGSYRPGFCLATFLLITLMLLMFAGGIQANLSLGPGGNFPGFRDVFLYAFSHDELPSLLVSVCLLLLVGPCQERRWGSVAFLVLSALTVMLLPLLYTLVLFVLGSDTSRVCGYSAVELALFTAQCRQVTRGRQPRCLPVWILPWIQLLLGLLLLPGTPALLNFCAICIGHNYHQSFIGLLQELEHADVFRFIPDSAYVSTTARFRLPSHTSSHRSELVPVDQAAPGLDHPPWATQQAAAGSEVEALEEQMLHAGILASLQDVHDDAKLEVPKSSVSSLRLQQLEKMGFATDKAVVALAASKQLEGAVSLLIDNGVGENAVVTSKGKNLV